MAHGKPARYLFRNSGTDLSLRHAPSPPGRILPRPPNQPPLSAAVPAVISSDNALI
jgi:hypothetical protein